MEFLPMMDTQTGRWTTEDPSGLGPDINPMRYVGNGPTDGTDPSGLQDKFENRQDAQLARQQAQAQQMPPSQPQSLGKDLAWVQSQLFIPFASVTQAEWDQIDAQVRQLPDAQRQQARLQIIAKAV
jgi:hypothetical protein